MNRNESQSSLENVKTKGDRSEYVDGISSENIENKRLLDCCFMIY